MQMQKKSNSLCKAPTPQIWPAAQLVTKKGQTAKQQEKMLLAKMLLQW